MLATEALAADSQRHWKKYLRHRVSVKCLASYCYLRPTLVSFLYSNSITWSVYSYVPLVLVGTVVPDTYTDRWRPPHDLLDE